MSKEQPDSLTVLRYSDLVQRRLFNNRMTLKRAIEAGDFPPAIHLGKNSLAWKAIDVQRWLDQRQSANRKSA